MCTQQITPPVCFSLICKMETVGASWVAALEERMADLEKSVTALEKGRAVDREEIERLTRRLQEGDCLRLGFCGDYTLFSNGNLLEFNVLDDGSPEALFARSACCVWKTLWAVITERSLTFRRVQACDAEQESSQAHQGPLRCADADMCTKSAHRRRQSNPLGRG